MEENNKASINKLKFCNFKLDSLLEITKAINENQSIDALLKKYERILQKELNIGKIILFQHSIEWRVILESGFQPGTFSGIRVERDLLHIEDITTTTSSNNILLHAFNLIIPVFHNYKPIAFVLIGDIEEEQGGISPTIKHLRFIQTFTNIIMVAIENKYLFEDNLRQEAIKKELELASQMQEMLVPDPKTFPKNDKIFIDAFYHPHLKVGGDYYDYIQLNDNEFGFCIADVSGKGISAALLMSNFQASLRALFNAGISLKELIVKLNSLVIKNTKGDKFITLFTSKYNIQTRELRYVNAGHNPPIIYHVDQDEVEYLEKGCPGLGMIEEIPSIEEGTLQIVPNTKILCYTDGLEEIEDEDHNQIGHDCIRKHMSTSNKIDKVIANLISELQIKDGNSRLFDDITILGIEFFL